MKNIIPNEELEYKIKTLPDAPGVYIMKNAEGTVIYVGKARNLKNRVRQYFGAQQSKHVKVAAMVSNIHTFEYIITSTELEALILECNLIKQYQPYYNILMRDDKHYPYVRINLNEDYPRAEIVRRVKNDGAKYFGPYIAAHSVREALDAVYKLFPIRSCKKDLSKPGRKKERPCLNYQMGRCFAPCAFDVDKEKYHNMLKEVIDMLSGKYSKLSADLKRQMYEASEELDFERAAIIRDKIAVLERISQRQRADFSNLDDKDIFAAAVDGEDAVVQAFFVRDGKLSRAEQFVLSAGDSNSSEVLESFLKQFYADKPNVPKNIYVAENIEDEELISQWLSGVKGSSVSVNTPKRGGNKQLADLAKSNAEGALARKKDKEKADYEKGEGALKKLAEALGIKGYLRRIECYDISNTQGTDSVASMVVSIDGKPKRSEYRRFRIKTVEGANDFASMAEVLERRLLRGFEAEDKETGFGEMPDLIVVDGGKGQLGYAVDVLLSLGLEIPIAGIAKREEELFLPGRSDPVILKRTSPELKIITALRDEAHRFAITYHRSLREKRVISSELDAIPGVGKVRKKALIDAFGDVEAIKKADVDSLVAVKGIDIATARAVYKHFNY